MLSIDLEKFPFDTVQDGSVFCIPAAVSAVLKYFDKNISIHQFGLMRLLILNTVDKNPSLGGIIEVLKPELETKYNFEHLFPTTFEEWKKNVTDNLSKSYPLIFATRISSGPHVRILIQFDKANDSFTIFDPGVEGLLKETLDSNGHINGANLIFSSLIKKYTIDEALHDWNNPDKCSDQLLIFPKS